MEIVPNIEQEMEEHLMMWNHVNPNRKGKSSLEDAIM